MCSQDYPSSPTFWEQTYWHSGDLRDDLLAEVARSYAEYHAAKLGVPFSEMHAFWTWDDHRDPLGNSITFGWRSDWTDRCPKKCDLHA